MSVYIYIYIYVYTYIYIYTHVYVYIYICVLYTHIYIYIERERTDKIQTGHLMCLFVQFICVYVFCLFYVFVVDLCMRFTKIQNCWALTPRLNLICMGEVHNEGDPPEFLPQRILVRGIWVRTLAKM